MASKKKARREVSASNLRANFSEILNKVAYGNETFVIIRSGKPIALLRSVRKK